MSRKWTVYKISKVQNIFDQNVFEVERATDANEADEGIEISFYGQQDEHGKQVVPARILRITPVLEDGKPRLRFEVEDLPTDHNI